MKKRFTTMNIYNGKEIKVQEGMQADCKVLDAIDQSLGTAIENGSGTMLLYDIILPRQYNHGNANKVFLKAQAGICKFQKRMDRNDTAPRYIAVRDALSQDAPRYKVAMFLPQDTRYSKTYFEERGTEITNGKLTDWKAYVEHDLMGICEKHGVEVKDAVPLDGTKEANDEAFYVASELAAVKIEPRAERTLFRSRKE